LARRAKPAGGGDNHEARLALTRLLEELVRGLQKPDLQLIAAHQCSQPKRVVALSVISQRSLKYMRELFAFLRQLVDPLADLRMLARRLREIAKQLRLLF
jgi:hypothetical protein